MMNALCAIAVFTVLATAVYGAPKIKIGLSKENNDVKTYFNKLSQKNETLSNVCTDCKLVASELKNVLKDPAKLNRLKIVLKLMCDYIGGTQAQECKSIIDNLDFLIHQFEPLLDDPEQFCKELHLCAHPQISMYSKLALKLMKFVVRTANRDTSNNDLLCDECVFAATEMNSMLRSTQVQQELKKELEQICKILSTFEQKCNQAVEQYFPMLLQFMQTLLSNPQKFCAQLQMCHAAVVNGIGATIETFEITVVPSLDVAEINRARSKLFLFTAPIIQTSEGHNALCVLCEYGFQSLINRLNNRNPVISREVSTVVCDMLPDDLMDDCKDFADIYASSIFRMLVNEWSPEEICTGMSACTNQSITAIKAMSDIERSSTVCEACRAFSEFVGYELRQPAFQQELIQLVKDNVCSILPGDLRNQCLDTADQYVPMVMQRTADYVGGKRFCLEVEMCKEANILQTATTTI